MIKDKFYFDGQLHKPHVVEVEGITNSLVDVVLWNVDSVRKNGRKLETFYNGDSHLGNSFYF